MATLVGLAAAALALAVPAAAGAGAYAPRDGRAFHGVSDTGSIADFETFADRDRRPPGAASRLLPLAGAADHRRAVPMGRDRHPRRSRPVDPDRRRRRDDHPAPDRPRQGRPLHDPDGGQHRRDRSDRLHPADGGDERLLERLLGLQRRRQRPPPRSLSALVQARLAALHPDHARRLARQDQPQADADGAAADPAGEVAGRPGLRGRPGRNSRFRFPSRCRSHGWR